MSPSSVKVNEMKNITLHCTGDAGLFETLTWSHNGKPISSNGREYIIRSKGSVFQKKESHLHIIHPRSSHSGNYSCVATPIRKGDEKVIKTADVVIYRKLDFFFVKEIL